MRLLTLEEVQRRLAVGRTTVYRLIRAGDLPTVKIRGSRRVREQDLEAFVEGRLGREPETAA